MRQWLATVKYCMRKRDGLNDDIRLFLLLKLITFLYPFKPLTVNSNF